MFRGEVWWEGELFVFVFVSLKRGSLLFCGRNWWGVRVRHMGLRASPEAMVDFFCLVK